MSDSYIFGWTGADGVNHWLEAGSRFLTSGLGVTILCALIALIGLAAFLRFRIKLSPLYRELCSVCGFLESLEGKKGLAAHMDDLDQRARGTRVMGHEWFEFAETLIYPEIGESDQVVRNALPAADFFSRDALLGVRINLRLYNALPNLLTGGGILGTFVGLVAGIYLAGNRLADPAQAQEAASDLLGGASLAFFTSIVGLTASILFSWREKHRLHLFEERRQCWVNGLDARLRRVTLESLSQGTLSENRRQTEVLANFTEQLAFQLTEALERTVPKALDEKVTVPLTQALEGLKASVDDMRDNQARTSEETLREIVDTFSRSISGAAGEEMREFTTAMETMSRQLRGQVAAVAAQQEAVRQQSQESVEKLANVFQKGADALQEKVSGSVDEILTGLSTTVSEMSALLDSTAKQMAGQLNQTASTFGDTVSSLTNSVDEIRKILTQTKDLMEYLDQLVAGTRRAHAEIQGVAKSLEVAATAMQGAAQEGKESASRIETSAQSLAGALARFEDSQERVEQTWAKYQERFERVDEALGKTFQEINDGLSRYAESIREFVKELDTHTGKITSALAGAVQDLGEEVEALQDALSASRE